MGSTGRGEGDESRLLLWAIGLSSVGLSGVTPSELSYLVVGELGCMPAMSHALLPGELTSWLFGLCPETEESPQGIYRLTCIRKVHFKG